MREGHAMRNLACRVMGLPLPQHADVTDDGMVVVVKGSIYFLGLCSMCLKQRKEQLLQVQ